MDLTGRISHLEQANQELQEKIDFLSFRLDLIANKTPVTELLYECNVTHEQYTKIMDLMDSLRNKLDNGEEISHGEYETEMKKIMTGPEYDYHFAEAMARAFMEERRWEEVFPALYGDFAKYKTYLQDRGKGE